MFVYISIGNSDDKLTQKEWSDFCADTQDTVESFGHQTHGVWFSTPAGPWQNACWCFEIKDDRIDRMKVALSVLARNYGQNWISWVQVPVTDVITPAKP